MKRVRILKRLLSFHNDFIYQLFLRIKNTEISRQLAEEEDACMSISNAMKKLASDAKRYKEATENMENK